MAYSPYTFDDLGAGLRLDLKADALGESEAIDALNVVFTEGGGIQSRAGYTEFTDANLTNDAESLFPYYTTSGDRHLLAGCGTRLEALQTDGTVIASDTGNTDEVWQFARYGTPSTFGSEKAYAGNGNDLLHSWDGTTWTAEANTPKAGALAVDAETNRLVATRFLTTAGGPDASADSSSPSHVYFSDAGDAESWDVDNFIQLTPGDGEQIQACISWREFVFVFKESKFFVFYGEETDRTGAPVFQYRTVDAGVGAVGPKCVAACEMGVFFLDRRGVYLTTGGEPELVSGPIDPIFLGGIEAYFQGGEASQGNLGEADVTVVGNRLYVTYSTDGVDFDRMLALDYVDGWWTLFDFAATAISPYALADEDELVFATTANKIMRHGAGLSDDDGTDITSRWRGGFHDLGIDAQKRIREQKVWGTGQIAMGVSADYKRDVGFEVQLDLRDANTVNWNTENWNVDTWATPAARIVKLRRYAILAHLTSVAIRGVTNQWSVHRITHHVAHMRKPSIKKAGV